MTKVNSLKHLYLLALNRQAVICPEYPPWRKPTPAAFIIRLQGTVLFRMFEKGMYIYQK